jgi:4-alpha-glucanotransferase
MSAFSGNPLLISPELLEQDGLLAKKDAIPKTRFPADKVDYREVIDAKAKVLRKAYRNFKMKADTREYDAFCLSNAGWLDDFALFMSIRAHFKGRLWSTWPKDIRDRDAVTIASLKDRYREDIEREKFFQYLFFRQWESLKSYCNKRNIKLFGDMPIYVNNDSVDTWMNPELFKLDEHKHPRFVAGVPPDYFSSTGQRWGNPVYDWDKLKEQRYDWWIKRFEQNFKLYDMLRLDHFRAFSAYWEIDANEMTAINGKWVEVPGNDFFTVMKNHFKSFPIVAEDLGVITDDVKELMACFCFPGMKILVFAFGGDYPKSPYLPENFTPNCIVYTGTHDNNTVRGWFEQDVTEDEKKHLFEYLQKEVTADEISDIFIRMGMESVAAVAVFPLQDVLGLDADSRMNTPSTATDNWKWRILPDMFKSETAARLAEITRAGNRIPQPLPAAAVSGCE